MHIFFIAISLISLVIPLGTNARYIPLINKSSHALYPFPGKSVKNMTEEELKVLIEYAKKIQDRDLVFKAFYHIINIAQDHAQIKVYKLDLADYCYGLEDYPKAATRYEEFCILYPGSAESEYAQYKLILCTFYISLAPDRDQADTIKTINLISLFLKRAKDPKLVAEMETIYATCRKRLFEHEVCVLETYLQQQKFTGAEHRLEYITKNFTDIPDVDKYLTYLQEMFELVKNPQTRPFTFKLKLENALNKKEPQEIKHPDVKKAVSFFVA